MEAGACSRGRAGSPNSQDVSFESGASRQPADNNAKAMEKEAAPKRRVFPAGVATGRRIAQPRPIAFSLRSASRFSR